MCKVCLSVSIRFVAKPGQDPKNFTCQDCLGQNNWSIDARKMLPVWIDEQNHLQYHVPPQLSCLREGEKLLIQQVSVYVPLHHLMYGQIGCRGHIVSFPQDVTSVYRTLPRLPEDVLVVRVIKRFKLGDGEVSSKSFKIRKHIVLSALIWLKRFNVQYKDIAICEENLDWIENGVEQELPATVCQDEVDPNLLSSATDEDLGPSAEQVAAKLTFLDAIEPTYGLTVDFNSHSPKQKDKAVMEAVKKAEMQGRLLNIEDGGAVIRFPYVSAEPVCEYSENHLFEYAFPWLFPGGTGGYMSGPNPKPLLKDWLKKTLQYNDGRFDNDRLWAFFALNYSTRHSNNGSGNFFVKSFFKNGPQTLEELQDQVSAGRLEWLDRISYFSGCVVGSSGYWRAKRREVFAWINYHLEKGNGVPTFFITLSCAEYHWKDIERLIQDRCSVAGLPQPDFAAGKLYLDDSTFWLHRLYNPCIWRLIRFLIVYKIRFYLTTTTFACCVNSPLPDRHFCRKTSYNQ
jgi:hypothetical protein